MTKLFLLLFAGLIVVAGSRAQSVPQKLAAAVAAFEADSQMRHAILGFCVVDSKTGKPVYEHNAQVGLAPASTQKLFTSAAALELLGKDYRYKTEIGYKGGSKSAPSYGFFVLKPSGDPTFGSWRYSDTKPDTILSDVVRAIKSKGIKKISATYKVENSKIPGQNIIPRGWIWEDIGNYYGAGSGALNWRENQYEIILRSGKKVGDPVEVVRLNPPATSVTDFTNELKSAAIGSGDNAFVFLPFNNSSSLLEGTIPVNENAFSISASIPDPIVFFSHEFINYLKQNNLEVNLGVNDMFAPAGAAETDTALKYTPLVLHLSPPLDSINYWFLRRSINLYGEALVKTIAVEKTGLGTTDKGIALVRDFWKEQGIDKSAIHIIDGSGLSPQNRVTTDAMVKVLQYAKTRPWYSSFYYALPEYNGMKMKSGSIGGARAFGGYHTAKDGKEYTYSIIVNNYDGSSGEAVKKLYKVLDVLK